MFVLIHENVKIEKFSSDFRGDTSKHPENHYIMCKAEYMSMHLKRVPHVWQKKKWCIFCSKGRVWSQLFGNFAAPACTWFHHNVVTYKLRVTITVTCLNFAVTGSQILLHPLSSSRRGKPSRKIALNSNGEVNYWELARRPWFTPGIQYLNFISVSRSNIKQ